MTGYSNNAAVEDPRDDLVDSAECPPPEDDTDYVHDSLPEAPDASPPWRDGDGCPVGEVVPRDLLGDCPEAIEAASTRAVYVIVDIVTRLAYTL